ncbi:hypothetical protein EG329_008550 [Mollisiaceae sp. DMI_Dod_QoI]|nr:hypothetical protein EG329_008550 [Helotiales sp. DMI_Dod_QoI]
MLLHLPSFVSPLEVSSRASQWIPTKVPFHFIFPKEDPSLAAVLVFRHKEQVQNEGPDLAVMLGSTSESGVGVSAIVIQAGLGSSLADFEGSFKPQVPGCHMLLDSNQVRVDIESRIIGRLKEYLVDINIDTDYSPRYSSPLDEIGWQIANGAPEPMRRVMGLRSLWPQTKHKEKDK